MRRLVNEGRFSTPSTIVSALATTHPRRSDDIASAATRGAFERCSASRG